MFSEREPLSSVEVGMVQMQHSRLLQLPAEIRKMIWEHLLSGTMIAFRRYKFYYCVGGRYPAVDDKFIPSSSCREVSQTFKKRLYKPDEVPFSVKFTKQDSTGLLNCPSCLDEMPAWVRSCDCALQVHTTHWREKHNQGTSSNPCKCGRRRHAYRIVREIDADQERKHIQTCNCELHGPLESPDAQALLVCRQIYIEAWPFLYGNTFILRPLRGFSLMSLQPKTNVYSLPKQIEQNYRLDCMATNRFSPRISYKRSNRCSLSPYFSLLNNLTGVESMTIIIDNHEWSSINRWETDKLNKLKMIGQEREMRILLRCSPGRGPQLPPTGVEHKGLQLVENLLWDARDPDARSGRKGTNRQQIEIKDLID